MTDTTALIREALSWIDQDPDQETRHELALLVEKVEHGNADAIDSLTELFSGHLTFGTAGLRAEIGAGPMRMNRVVVSHAAHGLGNYLVGAISGRTPRVVVGFDARRNSDVFATDTAEVLSGMGIEVDLMPHHTPTPVLAFAVRHLGADAGVMVTASHNPPADNGYKVYLGGADEGSQIVTPADREIHEAIMASHREQRATTLTRNAEHVTVLGEDMVDAYSARTLDISKGFSTDGRDALTICYTPMHGVGGDVFEELLTEAGFTRVHAVTEQRQPDGSFPTVSFPNPEEPGALDLAIALASTVKADLIVAHDPDADRLAIALPSRDGTGWTMLSGNEVGALLASVVASATEQRGERGVIGYSLVSSPVTAVIAEAHGHTAIETATGFKWISRLPGLIFGFEEALGYLVNPDVVRDKDGISAGLFALCFAANLHAEGKTLWDALDEVRARYGGFASAQVSLRFDSPELAKQLMAQARRDPDAVFPGLDISRITDYLQPPAGQPEADLLRYDLSSGERIIVRTSGTEPKLKVYLDSVRPHQQEAANAVAALDTTVREAMSSLEGKTLR